MQNLPHITVQNWNDKLAQDAITFLQQYQETSLFLLNVLSNENSNKTNLLSSENCKCLLDGDKVIGVFLLNDMGRLLLQTDRKTDYSHLIVSAIAPKISQFTGLIGDWELTEKCWDALQLHFPNLQRKIYKKEILYSYDLKNLPKYTNNIAVRFLTADDYDAWNNLNLAFCKELNSVLFHNNSQRKPRYINEVNKQHWWGLFKEQELVAISCYLGKFADCAQIGGVYTLPEFRGEGLAKELVKQIMQDSKNKHDITKLILFTDKNNSSAQKVYEKLEFQRIGYIGLVTCGF